jgi:N-acetylmuramoyl-L-alanine amidase
MIVHHPSPNFDRRPADVPLDMLVLHYTGMPCAEAALARLTDAAAEVSAHYMIDEDGTCYALVAETDRAWHAGRSSWRGQTNVNARSIGIELVNPGHEFGYRAFPTPQMTTLTSLAKDILTRHPIPPRNVVGHSDVAPWRKEDPGELFGWQALAAHGIGLWPETDKPLVQAPALDGDWPAALTRLGYDVTDRDGNPPGSGEQAALVAFQRHYRPTRFDGRADSVTITKLNILLRMAEETSP